MREPEEIYLRSLLHGVHAVVLVIAIDGTIREWNRRAESLYGVSREEALGSSYFQLVPGEERDRLRDAIRRLATGGEPTVEFVSAARTPEGVRTVLWSATLVEDARGEPVVLATGATLTQSEAAERVLRESGRRAFEAEKLAAINALIAGIAHDVGAPMTAILGYAELLAKSVGDDKNRKRAATIVQQVHRVSGLLDTLMNLASTAEHPLMRLELTGIVDSALDSVRAAFEQCRIEVERHDEPAPRVHGDPGRLQHVLRNLFMSAIEGMPGGGTLRVSLGETDAGEAEVRICDTGSGTSPHVGARSSEPHWSTKQGAMTTGLGVLLAAIVEEHQGNVSLSREPNRGTVYRLTLPGV